MALDRIYNLFDRISRRKKLDIVDDVLRLKKLLRTRNELGLEHPISISAVVPTFLKTPEDLSGYSYEVLRNELVILGQLLSGGILDEVLIIDGSRDTRDGMDERLVRQIISSAYRSIPLFNDQVNQLNKFPPLKYRAKLGLKDFVFKVIHQMDPQIDYVVKKLSLFPQKIPPGKGAALWLSIGATSGDIILFIDSDIRSLEDWQVAALIEPLLRTFEDEGRDVELVKAYYTRLSVNLDSPEKGFYKLGGRVTRLFILPMFRVLSKFGVLSGIEKLRYPLSGEFAGTRELIETLNFPVDYGVEAGMLFEIWKRGLTEKVTEADLQLFQHFPQSDSLIEIMVVQIVDILLRELRDYIEFNNEIVNDYVKEAYREIELTQALFDKVEFRSEMDHKVKRSFYRDVEGDKKRVDKYAKIFKDAISGSDYRINIKYSMPPWREVNNTLEGKQFENFLQRISVIYTCELLEKQGILA